MAIFGCFWPKWPKTPKSSEISEISENDLKRLWSHPEMTHPRPCHHSIGHPRILASPDLPRPSLGPPGPPETQNTLKMTKKPPKWPKMAILGFSVISVPGGPSRGTPRDPSHGGPVDHMPYKPPYRVEVPGVPRGPPGPSKNTKKP